MEVPRKISDMSQTIVNLEKTSISYCFFGCITLAFRRHFLGSFECLHFYQMEVVLFCSFSNLVLQRGILTTLDAKTSKKNFSFSGAETDVQDSVDVNPIFVFLLA